MTKIKQEIFNDMKKLGLIVSEKHSKNYARTKRYKHVEDEVCKEYERIISKKINHRKV